jgi:hypothetical protein
MAVRGAVPVFQSILAGMRTQFDRAGLLKKCTCPKPLIPAASMNHIGTHHADTCPMKSGWMI